MMEDEGYPVLYSLLVAAIVVAAGILGYYTFKSTREYAALGEQTIAQSLLLVAQDRVERIERYIEGAGERALQMVNPNDISSTRSVWLASDQPDIDSLFVLNERKDITDQICRAPKRRTCRVARRSLVRALDEFEFDELTAGETRHVHKTSEKDDSLFSYQVRRTLDDKPVYVVAKFQQEYLKETLFPRVLASTDDAPKYNVVDENNQLIYGPDLTESGDYLVGHKFPATLYGWRLQVAPRQGALLKAQQKSRLRGEASLPLMSFAIILLSAIFFVYAAAKERRLHQMKSEFIANVSHELKTPLSVVRMFGDMLRSRRVTSEAKQQQYLEIICRESERLTSLIENVLDFSAIESGRQPYELRDADLLAVVLRALEAFRYRSEQDGVQVRLRVPDELPVAQIDEEAITLALINLLDNAVKYGGQTPIEVCVASKGRYVDVEVRDGGPGIPPDSAPRLFERFYRGERPPETRGSGIGLSLVKRIAEAHGGRAWARNHDDGGAVVGFRIRAAA